jgi:hypothetical protein
MKSRTIEGGWKVKWNRKAVAAACLLLGASAAYAKDLKIEFSILDSPLTQGKKFEQAFKRGEQIARIDLDGKILDLFGEWMVVKSGYRPQEINVVGSGPNKDYVMGEALLVRAGKLQPKEGLFLSVYLGPPRASVRQAKTAEICLASPDALVQTIDKVEDKRESCQRVIYHTAQSGVQQPASAASSTQPATKEKLMVTQLLEIRGADTVFMQRISTVDGQSVDAMSQWAAKVRASIRSAYGWN